MVYHSFNHIIPICGNLRKPIISPISNLQSRGRARGDVWRRCLSEDTAFNKKRNEWWVQSRKTSVGISKSSNDPIGMIWSTCWFLLNMDHWMIPNDSIIQWSSSSIYLGHDQFLVELFEFDLLNLDIWTLLLLCLYRQLFSSGKMCRIRMCPGDSSLSMKRWGFSTKKTPSSRVMGIPTLGFPHFCTTKLPRYHVPWIWNFDIDKGPQDGGAPWRCLSLAIGVDPGWNIRGPKYLVAGKIIRFQLAHFHWAFVGWWYCCNILFVIKKTLCRIYMDL